MKKYVYRILLMVVLFCVVVLGVFFITNKEEELPKVTTMDMATLPIVNLKLEDSDINMLHGYTQNVDATTVRDSITPLMADRKLPISIKTYNNTVNRIEYEVRSLDMTRLVEDTEVKEFSTGDDYVNATLNIKNLLDEGKEYLLKIKITCNEDKEIDYYTRIIYYETSDAVTYMNFAKGFSDNTFSQDTIENVIPYLETSSLGDNTNIGKVNINCKMSQIGFAGINPVKTSDTRVTFKEIAKNLVTVELDYTMQSSDDTYTYNYEAKEVYKLKYSRNTMYVLAYDRELNQIFSESGALTSTGKVNLGISPDYTYDYMTDEDENFICFVINRELWCYNIEENTFTEIFSFRNKETDGIRENFNNHDIKILSISDKGIVRFMVYGYMNRGVHEGKTGLGIFEFSYEDNMVNEMLFIPASTGYEVLKTQIDSLHYLSDKDILYVMFEDSIYSIDLVGKESMVIVKDARIGSYVVSEDNTILAWQEEGEEYNSRTANVLYLTTGDKNTFTVADNMRIKPLGFINHDFIYGEADAGDVINSSTGEMLFPMSKITIVSDQNVVKKEYQIGGIYVTKAAVDGNRVTFKRMTKSEDGTFVATSDDQIISSDSAEESKIGLTVVATEARQKETYLTLGVSAVDITKVKMHSSKEVIFSEAAQMELPKSDHNQEIYYAYGNGELIIRTDSMAEAVAIADKQKGVVTDGRTGEILWVNALRDSYGTSDIAEITAADGNGMAESLIIMNQVIYNNTSSELNSNMRGLTGCTCDMMLYYVSKGWPVMAKISANTYGVIYQYDQFNITVYDPVTATSTKIARDEATDYFAQFGNIFVTAVYTDR